MSIVAWRVSRYGGIERKEFDRETEHFYIYNNGRRERREAKSSRFGCYYPTKEAAEAADTAIMNQRVANKRRGLAERAALDLLAALVDLEAQAQQQNDAYGKPNSPSMYAALTSARAAIAKATGASE